MTLSPALPHEILAQIFDSLNQPSLHACSLTCRSWYASSIAFLYRYPLISGANFDTFVAAICPSINAHVRHNGLASLVKVLDMRNLVHNGRKSLTARLLGRMKGSLEYFIAPQATFAINSLAALSKCHALRTLNLTLVSETIPHSALFSSISQLPNLHTLHLPHSYAPSPSSSVSSSAYPPALRALHITGSVTDNALIDLSCPPIFTLTHTTIASTPQLSPECINLYFIAVADTLTSLTLGPHLRRCAMHDPGLIGGKVVLPSMPALREMSVVLAYLDWRTMREKSSSFPRLTKATLDGDLETSGEGKGILMAGPATLADAVESEMMPRLRILRVRKHLRQWVWPQQVPPADIMYRQWIEYGWDDAVEGGEGNVRDRIARLDALLKEKARKDRMERERNEDTGDPEVSAKDLVSETEAGVIFFGPSRKP